MPKTLTEKHLKFWTAVFGASVARQSHDRMDVGRDITDEVMDRIVEEAESIADMAVDAMQRAAKN
jgi:hypothetical protein